MSALHQLRALEDSITDLSSRLETLERGGGTPDPLMTLEEVATCLRLDRVSVWRVRNSDKSFPAPILISARPRFERVAIEKWLRAQTE